jgi:hypothetical protein
MVETLRALAEGRLAAGGDEPMDLTGPVERAIAAA